jgi:alpha-amylase
MIGIVLNHVGPVDLDFSSISPFNSPSHYHSKCQVIDYNNQTQVEYCRLANLPDLDQDNSFVLNKLIDSVTWLVDNFDPDGLRVDTVPFISKNFWNTFMQSTVIPKLNNIYLVGEVFNGNIGYVSGYANIIGATLDYPLYFSLRNVFGQQQAMFNIRTTLNAGFSMFKDPYALALFIDNHDNERFLHTQTDIVLYKNAITFTLFARGIPIIYYGTEQAFNGGGDPQNREHLWNHFNIDSDIYTFIRTLLTFKNKHINEIVTSQHIERYVSNNFYAFSRGNVFIATTNAGSGVYQIQYTITYHPYKDGTILCNVLYPSDCITVNNGHFDIELIHGESKVFYPK